MALKKKGKKLQFKKAAKWTFFAVEDLMKLEYFEQTWKNIVVLALIVIFLTVVVDLILVRFFNLDEQTLFIVEVLDYAAIGIMAIDLIYHLYKAKDKKKYLQENSLLLLSFLPYFAIFRIFRFLIVLKDVGFIFKFAKIYMHKHHFGFGDDK